jgi:hypothetical protein
LGGDPKATKVAARQAARRDSRKATRQAERKNRALAETNLEAAQRDQAKFQGHPEAAASSSLAVRATDVLMHREDGGDASVVVTHPTKHGYAFVAGSDPACVCAAHGFKALYPSSGDDDAAAVTTVANAEACYLWTTCDILKNTGCTVQPYVRAITCSAEPSASDDAESATQLSAARQLRAASGEPIPLAFLRTETPTKLPTRLPSHAPTHKPSLKPSFWPTRVPSHSPTVTTRDVCLSSFTSSFSLP